MYSEFRRVTDSSDTVWCDLVCRANQVQDIKEEQEQKERERHKERRCQVEKEDRERERKKARKSGDSNRDGKKNHLSASIPTHKNRRTLLTYLANKIVIM